MTREYMGQALADSQDVVYVSMNYRLGPLGWLYHPHLQTQGSAADRSGNYGTLDILQALQWIRENISAFGGDPANILVSGESAGGANVLSLLIAPQADGLYHKALAQSGYSTTYSLEEAAAFTESLAARLLTQTGQAPDTNTALQQIRNMQPEEFRSFMYSQPAHRLVQVLYAPMMGMIAMPFILRDGTVIPLDGFDSIRPGTYHRSAPVILGSNSDEVRLFQHFGRMFQDDRRIYELAADFSSQLWKANGVDEIARRLSAAACPVWVYEFSWGSQDEQGTSVLPGPWGWRLGAFHSLDISFFTGTESVFSGYFNRYVFTAQNRPGRQLLSAAMRDYVASFHRWGDPSITTPSLPRWEPWSSLPGGPRTFILDAGLTELRLRMTGREYFAPEILSRMEKELDPAVQKQLRFFLIR